jgi:hypothetical protein
MGASRRIRRTRRGFAVRLPGRERDLLRALPAQLGELLDGSRRDDPALRRLYPAAHLDDPAAADEFDRFVRDDLTEQRRRALDEMARTLDADLLTEEELGAWLAVINDTRLVLGVRLSVTEESVPADFGGDEQTAGSFAVYAYLSMLEEEIVEALSAGVR